MRLEEEQRRDRLRASINAKSIKASDNGMAKITFQSSVDTNKVWIVSNGKTIASLNQPIKAKTPTTIEFDQNDLLTGTGATIKASDFTIHADTGATEKVSVWLKDQSKKFSNIIGGQVSIPTGGRATNHYVGAVVFGEFFWKELSYDTPSSGAVRIFEPGERIGHEIAAWPTGHPILLNFGIKPRVTGIPTIKSVQPKGDSVAARNSIFSDIVVSERQWFDTAKIGFTYSGSVQTNTGGWTVWTTGALGLIGVSWFTVNWNRDGFRLAS